MCRSKEIDITPDEMKELFWKIRETRLLDPCKINSTIRVRKNTYTSEYGPVTILRGDGTEVIGTLTAADPYLLDPEQNKGRLFHIDLSDPKVLIIGTKALLEKFSNHNNVVFSENLTDAQEKQLICGFYGMPV